MRFLPSTATPAGLDSVRRFRHYRAALKAIADYQVTLHQSAMLRRTNGMTVTDQDQPEEAFCLCPIRPSAPPLVIIGGMGPLAGAQAFRNACARFRIPVRWCFIRLAPYRTAPRSSCGSAARTLSGATQWPQN